MGFDAAKEGRSAGRARASWLALGAIALWSSVAALGVRLRGVPPFFLVGAALTIGGLAGASRLSRAALRPRVIALGVYGFFAYHFCLFMALRLAPPVEANLLNYLWPLLIVLLSPVLVPGSALRPRHVLGAALGFCGAAVLVSGGARFTPGALAGDALAVAAAVIWSTYSLWTSRLGGAPTATVSASLLVSGLLALACHAALEPRFVPTLAESFAILFMGAGPLGAAFYLWDRALKDGDPRGIGTLSYLTPLLSTALIAALGQGTLTHAAVAAAALVVGGAAIGSL